MSSSRIKSARNTMLPISTPTIVSGRLLVMLTDFVGQALDALAELVFAEQGFHGSTSRRIFRGKLGGMAIALLYRKCGKDL